MQYIKWLDETRFENVVELGVAKEFYNFLADYNTIDDSWYITISTLDNILLIASKKLVLRVDLFKNTDKTKIPLCLLFPDSSDPLVERIGYHEMVNGTVKLFHILP